MARGPVSTDRLVLEAFAALEGASGVDVQAAQHALASAAKALAQALPVRDGLYGPDLDGHPMSPEEIKAAAVDARCFLELVADLLGSPGDPDWMGDDFAFSGHLKRRPDWKPPAEPTAAQSKRRAAAVRVYEKMAEQCCDTGKPPKQEAAIASVMEEYGLARSKIMAALREYRDDMRFLGQIGLEGSDPDAALTRDEEKELTHWRLARQAMEREWFKRNPDAQFLGVPAGSDLEKQLLIQKRSP